MATPAMEARPVTFNVACWLVVGIITVYTSTRGLLVFMEWLRRR